MITRKFDKESYKLNDKRAKDTIRRWLDSRGIYSHIDEDYGVDIKAYNPDTKRFSNHEVEMKNMWDGDWPCHWNTIHIPERKKKLLHNDRLFFWIIKGDCSEAWFINGGSLTDSILEEVPNRCIAQGERFFKVPIEKCKLVKF